MHSDFTSSPKHRHSQSRLKDISIATHSSFSQINQEVGISDKCHLLIFQRDKFWWCDQQVPRLFLACSTKIVTMATLRGQTSKEMHCEHRNSRALSRKKEGGSVGRFPMWGAELLPASPGRTAGCCVLGTARLSVTLGLLLPGRERKCEFVGNGRQNRQLQDFCRD